MKQRSIELGLLGLAIAVLVSGLLLWRPWGPAAAPEAAEVSVENPPPPRGGSKSGAGAGVERVSETKRGVSPEERERYREAIRDRAQRREVERRADGDAQPRMPDMGGDDPGRNKGGAGGGLTDRSGGALAGLLEDLQGDVMPLADECYSLARESEPELAGGLDLEFQVVGDEEVGGLVDSVDFLESSEIQNEELIECMRETLLSTVFPAPDDSGNAGVKLTLRFSPDEDD